MFGSPIRSTIFKEEVANKKVSVRRGDKRQSVAEHLVDCDKNTFDLYSSFWSLCFFVQGFFWFLQGFYFLSYGFEFAFEMLDIHVETT